MLEQLISLSTEQIILTSTILVLLGLFIWNKYRYDAISVASLIFLVTISSSFEQTNLICVILKI